MLAAVRFVAGFVFVSKKTPRTYYSVKPVIVVVVLCVCEEMMRHHHLYTKGSH